MVYALLPAILCFGWGLQADVVAYWRFEEGPVDTVLPRGGLPDGVFYGVVADSSGHSNALSAWSQGGYAGYVYRADVPVTSIPLTGDTNTLSVQNTDGFPVMFTSPTAAIQRIRPKEWTIEASFKPERGGYRTIVGRDSYGAVPQDSNLAALYFQIEPNDAVAIKYCDIYGFWHQAVSVPGLIRGFAWPNTSAGHWYHMAAVCDGKWLTLYLNDVDAGTGYQLVAATDLTQSESPDTRMTAGFGSGGDWVAGTWSVGRGLYAGGHTDRAYGFIDEVRISDEPLTPDEFLFSEEEPPVVAEAFRIIELGTNDSAVVDHNALTGDDRGGIAISSSHVFYSGDSSTARFRSSDLSEGTSLGQVYDSLVSDLKTERVYLLGQGSIPLGGGGGLVTSLLGVDGATGYLNGERIDLSAPIGMTYNSGIFAGYGQIVLYTANRVHSIELPSGRVRSLGPLSFPPHMSTENWAIWGLAETIGDDTFLAYVRDSRTIVRTRVSDGLTFPINEFSDLSDMACFTVSVPLGRWYFHYEYGGQFGGLYETLGFAEAAFDTSPTNPPAVLNLPQSLTVVEGDEVSFQPLYAGSPPFHYQWRKDGEDLPSATNASFSIATTVLSDSGVYSVVVSNVYGSATSPDALLSVVPVEQAVAVFDDPAFVDTGGSIYSSSDNVQASLKSRGFAVRTFTSLYSAAATYRRLVFPALEFGDPSQVLSANDRAVVSNFVQNGGSIILFGDYGENSIRVLNTVFGLNLQADYQSFGEAFTRSTGVYGTEFADDPEDIPLNYYTVGLRSGSLPPTGRSLYEEGSRSGAALVEWGGGVVIYLGWSWSDARPRGSQDGGWLDLLESAATQPAPLPPVPPLIVGDPRNKDILTGGDWSLSVDALGTQPLSYHWSLDGSPIPNATNASFSIHNAQPSDAGSYVVTVSNALGWVTSSPAVVRVSDIVLLSELGDRTVITLGPTVFSVIAIAVTDDLVYRWYKDGELIVGATNDYLELGQTRFSDAGTYTVEVSNADGLVIQTSAELTIASPVGGDVDFSFNPGASFEGEVRSVAVQANGKVLLSGLFSSIGGVARAGLARLNPDGRLDHSFMNGLAGVNGQVEVVLPQPDGQVLIGGSFQSVNGEPRNGIARLNPDGSVDESFQHGLSGVGFDWVSCLALQPDGKVLIGGYFYLVNGIGRNGIARLNADGSLDESFQEGMSGVDYGSVESLVLEPDGKVLIGGQFFTVNGMARNGVARLNADGSLDESFQDGMSGLDYGYVQSLVLQPDGKVVIGGQFLTVNGTVRNGIARLNADGSLDESFQDGMIGVDYGYIYSLALEADGKVVIGGYFSSVNGTARNGIARLNADGSLDESFQDGMSGVDYGYVSSLALEADGKVVIGGSFYSVNGQLQNGYARLNPDGSLNPNVPASDGVNGYIEALALQLDGKVLIGGGFTSVGGLVRNGIARLNRDGSVDESFQDGMVGVESGSVSCIAVQPDGKVLVGGYFQSVNGSERNGIARLNPDGSLDASFQEGMTGVDYGQVLDVALQPDGKVLIGGYFQSVNGFERNGIARLNPDGSLDASFQEGMTDADYRYVLDVALQPDGKVLIGGYFESVNGVPRRSIARLEPNGALDTSFQNDMSGVQYVVQSMAVQPDGRVLIGGYIYDVNGQPRNGLARLNPDGSLDDTFSGGTAGSDFIQVISLALQPDGRVLMGGSFQSVNGAARHGIARLNADGSVDTSFQQGMDGVGQNYVTDLLLQPDGKVLIAGDFPTVNGEAIGRVARLWGGPPAPITITEQPESQVVQLGESAVFDVVFTGEAPLTFQWCREGGDLAGETNAVLTLAGVLESDEGFYSVKISNPFERVISSNAFLTVNQPPVADAGATAPVVISENGIDGAAILDGSRSFDPDGDSLDYTWFEAGSAVVLAEGMIVVQVLPIGNHIIELVVSDGALTDTNAVDIEIITTADAVSRLLALTQAEVARSRPLEATLSAALAALDRGNPTAAINQLLAFQNQVYVQVAPADPALAALLINSSQEVLNALTGGRTNPGGQPHGRMVARVQPSDASVRVEFDGQAARSYVIEASSNLVDWEPIAVSHADQNGRCKFEDPAARNLNQRYYRVVAP